MPSNFELTQPPIITSQQREVLQAMAMERNYIDGEMRQTEPLAERSDANNFHEVLTDIFYKHGRSESSRIKMSCQELGGVALSAEFTPDGIYNLEVNELTLAKGILLYRAKIINAIMLPLKQQVMLPRLIQTQKPTNPLLRPLTRVDAAVATKREVNDAISKARRFLQSGKVEKVI